MSAPETDPPTSHPPTAPQAGFVDRVAAGLAERLQAVSEEFETLPRERVEPLREEQRRLRAAVSGLET